MAGHSKWNNIKRTKEVQDKKRAAIFTKVARDITSAVKLGGSPDPGFNPLLKVAIDKAKSVNMPNDNIDRAIKRASGGGEGEITYENTYEFYGPDGSMFLVDCETDNTNRTVSELKTLANKNGLKIANAGSISWQFEELGIIEIGTALEKSEEVTLELLELEGILDIQEAVIEEDATLFISVSRENLNGMTNHIKENLSDVEILSANLVKKANALVSSTPRLVELLDMLTEFQDTVSVYTNFE